MQAMYGSTIIGLSKKDPADYLHTFGYVVIPPSLPSPAVQEPLSKKLKKVDEGVWEPVYQTAELDSDGAPIFNTEGDQRRALTVFPVKNMPSKTSEDQTSLYNEVSCVQSGMLACFQMHAACHPPCLHPHMLTPHPIPFVKIAHLEISSRIHQIPEWVLLDEHHTKLKGVVKKAAFITDFKPKEGYTPKPQAAHVDYRVTGEDRFLRVMMTAITPFSLLVWPGSHQLVRMLPEAHEWSSDGGFAGKSTEKMDRVMAEVANQVRMPQRILLEAGQTIIFDGYLIHAGDEQTELGDFRLHRYLMDEASVIEVDEAGEAVSFPLNALNDTGLHTHDFRKMFWDPSQ